MAVLYYKWLIYSHNGVLKAAIGTPATIQEIASLESSPARAITATALISGGIATSSSTIW